MNSILAVALSGRPFARTFSIGHTGAVRRLQRITLVLGPQRRRATKWSGLSRQFALSGGSAAGIATRIFTGVQAYTNTLNLMRSTEQAEKSRSH
jgi:hypothetical protein